MNIQSNNTNPSVRTQDIVDAAVTTEKIANNSITSDKLNENSLYLRNATTSSFIRNSGLSKNALLAKKLIKECYLYSFNPGLQRNDLIITFRRRHLGYTSIQFSYYENDVHIIVLKQVLSDNHNTDISSFIAINDETYGNHGYMLVDWSLFNECSNCTNPDTGASDIYLNGIELCTENFKNIHLSPTIESALQLKDEAFTSVLPSRFLSTYENNESRTIPYPCYDNIQPETPYIVNVNTQGDWDSLSQTLSGLMNSHNEILVSVQQQIIYYTSTNKLVLSGLAQECNIFICGNGVSMVPAAADLDASCVMKDQSSVDIVYTLNHDINPVNVGFLDCQGNFFDLIDDKIYQCKTVATVSTEDPAGDIFVIDTDLPDLQEDECRDFYILVTQWYHGIIHKVVRVHNGQLFAEIRGLSHSESWNYVQHVNYDNYYANLLNLKRTPRYKLINCPFRNGIRIHGRKIYIPRQLNTVSLCESTTFIDVNTLHVKRLVIQGFSVLANGGGAYSLVNVNNSIFEDQLFIRDNVFANIKSKIGISVCNSSQVNICGNTFMNIYNTAIQISQGSQYNSVTNNFFRNCGLAIDNTPCIACYGQNFLVAGNHAENFGHSFANVGIVYRADTQVDSLQPCSGIVECNVMTFTKDYTQEILKHSLMDTGAIYAATISDGIIIRHNIIENYDGALDNRSIFLDDGAYNYSIYGNLILNTANSWAIDSRKVTLDSSWAIPRYSRRTNTNNIIMANILTEPYRFENRDESDNNNIKGQNIVLLQGYSSENFVRQCKIKDFGEQQYESDMFCTNSCFHDGEVQVGTSCSALFESLRSYTIDNEEKNYLRAFILTRIKSNKY